MLLAMSTAHEQTKRMAIICVIAFVAINVVFYFLSGSYFESHRQIVASLGSVSTYSPEQMMQVRMMFAVFSGGIAVATFLAGSWPRIVGHVIPVLIGVAHLVASVAAFWHHDVPRVVGVTLFVFGVLVPVLAWYSYRHSRPAWAFLVAISGVFAVVELFGAPKIRGTLDISLWITMILPGLNAVAAMTLASLRGEYVERDPVAA